MISGRNQAAMAVSVGIEPGWWRFDGLASVIRSMVDVRNWIAERREPRFILPARFSRVSFSSFEVTPAHPEHQRHLDLVAEFVADADDTPRRFWQRRQSDDRKGLFLVGPPGVGKTHLLASGYLAADVEKLFASFDELVAAAGPLGMQRLSRIVSEASLVCIDEVVLEDPGNIMMLVTLLQQMTESETSVIATANMPPEEAGGRGGWMATFERELGSISSTFDVVRLEGRDRREDENDRAPTIGDKNGSTMRTTWPELQCYLRDTHPMHDAGWLEQVAEILVDGAIGLPGDRDEALRFVRFIDRVYDRDVALNVQCPHPTPAELVSPLDGDPRYVWHIARGKSRLTQLLR
ncbi:MAG: AFG1/ZapE family ATPase [Thermomicrobiales bacterium]